MLDQGTDGLDLHVGHRPRVELQRQVFEACESRLVLRQKSAELFFVKIVDRVKVARHAGKNHSEHERDANEERMLSTGPYSSQAKARRLLY